MLFVLLVLLLSVVALLLPSVYLMIITLAGFFYRRSEAANSPPRTRFAVLVPAHNEETLLPELLESLRRVEYPSHLFDVYVVADNCTDNTATVAREHGVRVYERSDESLRGKPYALKWLLERIAEQEVRHDAFIFLDADTVISHNFLKVMDYKFRDGSQAVQARYTVSNPDESPASAMRFIAFELFNYVRPLGKSRLGLPSGLYGTGMGFSKEIMDANGWDAFTLAEDVEYALKLVQQGVNVDYAPEAKVSSRMPTSLRDAQGQNVRWEKGRLMMARTFGIPLLTKGLLQRNISMFTAGFEQFIPPISLMGLALVPLLAISVLIGSRVLISLSAASLIAFGIHVFFGLVSAKAPWRVYWAFVFAPWFVVWKLSVYARALTPGEVRWTRSKR